MDEFPDKMDDLQVLIGVIHKHLLSSLQLEKVAADVWDGHELCRHVDPHYALQTGIKIVGIQSTVHLMFLIMSHF